ncbi:MAG: hypothetical protein JNL82_29910 [Myxococcales bacterium]|nr:hypothetical protein [Myxococcales bacterium]
MAELADLRMRTHMRHAYLLLIEGVPFAFTDEPDLTSGWWLLDDRRILGGLSVPRNLRVSLDLESGLIEEDSATFQLLDIDGTIPRFFGGLEKPYQQLGRRLPAGTAAIAAPLVGADQDSIPADEGGYIGTEAIGPDGERGYYSHVPWAFMPGQDHPAIDEPFPVFTTRETGPLLVEGRRVALYRLIYDPETGAWPSFGDQIEAAAAGGWSRMLWWGTLRQAGKVEGRVWSVAIAGPGSWLRRSLGSRAPTKWYPVTSEAVFSDNERKVSIDFYKSEINGTERWYGHDVATYSVPDGTPAAVAAYLATAITTVAGAAGQDGVWTSDVPVAGAAASIDFGLGSVTVSTLSNAGFAARLNLNLHIRVWRLLGWDPLYEPGSLAGPQPLFTDGGDGYFLAFFATVPPGSDPISQDGSGWDGDGIPRIYKPLYVGGVSILSGAGDQVVSIATENLEQLYCEGQTIRPRPSFAELEGTPVDAWRLWAFKGPIQLPGQDEPQDTVQVARCGWLSDGAGVVEDDASNIHKGLYISRWLDPRLFGLDYAPIDKTTGWVSNDGAEDVERQIQCSPLTFFGLKFNQPDRAADTIVRILASTGTGAWDPTKVDVDDDNDIKSYSASWFTEGTNSTGLDFPAMDAEIYDLSLQIPAAMIDTATFGDVVEDLPGGASGPLALGKVAIQGTSIQSEELLGALLAPRGWCFSLKRGRIGLFAPHIGSEGKYQDGVDLEITPSDLHGEAGDPASTIPEVELRPVYPFDRVTVSYAGSPVEAWLDGMVDYSAKARDPGARARLGTRSRDVKAPDLIATEWFVDGPSQVDAGTVLTWQNELRKLWEISIASWLARPHRLLTGLRIARPKGQDIYPGAILRLTNPWPANSVGGYGVVGGYARVLSVTIETDSCAAVVDCLLEGQATTALRWAPIVRVVDDVEEDTDRFDPITRKFFVQNWGGSPPPLAAFIKPANLNAPEQPAKLIGLQYDGNAWAASFSCYVEAVSTLDNSITLTGGGIDGIYRNRKYTVLVLAPRDDPEQAEWVGALYARHTALPPSPTAPKLPV